MTALFVRWKWLTFVDLTAIIVSGRRIMPISKLSISDRFWSKVLREPGPQACWEWQAYSNPGGPGRFRLRGKLESAPRVAYMLEMGSIPQGACVLHRCDNPRCCNPRHLYIGSKLDNSNDKFARGRAVTCPGQHNGSSKLTADAVANIRQMYDTGLYSKAVLAREFGITRTMIYLIVTRKNWR